MKTRFIFLAIIFMVSCTKKTESNTVVETNAATNNPNIYSIQIGEYTISLLSEGQNEGSTDLLIGANDKMIAEYAPHGSFPMATNAFLVQTPTNNILFDTGYGKLLFDNLNDLGVKAENLNAIIITHMHGDHIGGLLKNQQPTFPNTKLYIPQSEYDYWISADNEVTKNVLEIYKDNIVLFEPNSLENITNSLLPGIQPITAYGHTPGHTTFLIESNNEKLLIWGDLTHAMVIQMPYPEVALRFDSNPDEAIKARLSLLEFVSKNNIPVAGMHIPYPGIGEIKSVSEKGYEFLPKQ